MKLTYEYISENSEVMSLASAALRYTLCIRNKGEVHMQFLEDRRKNGV